MKWFWRFFAVALFGVCFWGCFGCKVTKGLSARYQLDHPVYGVVDVEVFGDGRANIRINERWEVVSSDSLKKWEVYQIPKGRAGVRAESE